MLILNEDLFDNVDVPDVVIETPAVEVEEPGPEAGNDTGIANEILALINDENEAIQGYYNFKANLQGREEFASLIDDIAAEELNHVGMLQKMLEKIAPHADNIEAGVQEAEQDLGDADLISTAFTMEEVQ